MNATIRSTQHAANRRFALKLGAVALAFGGLGFALVPLYDAICKATGLGGRVENVATVPAKNTQVDESRWVNVEFLSHTMPGVSVDLKPEQFSMRVHPGAIIHTHYTARNTSSQVLVAQAIPSITPAAAAPDFQKIECFCFNQQTLQPGEERVMPVVFVVRPELRDDLRTVTLSYTFFEITKPEKG